MNKVILFGNVGKDPEVKTLAEGKKVAKFSLATSEHSKDKDGNKVSTATWHNIVVWDKLAELCEKFVKKGSSIILEGKISYRTYEDKDGNTKYYTEIVCNTMHFAGGKKEESQESNEGKFQKAGDVTDKAEDDPSFDPFA
jgi:single-strand DNA-binding protein